MKLKKIGDTTYQSIGFGAGSGDVINEIYECPCGKGKVFYEKDDIPGFKNSSISSDCKECENEYNFSRGFATLI